MKANKKRRTRSGAGFIKDRRGLFKLTMVLLLFFTVSGCGGMAENAAQAKPSVPIDFGLTLLPSDQIPGEYVLTARGVPGVDAPLFRIRIQIPEGVEVTGGQNEWEGPLKKGEQKEIEVFLKAPESTGQRIFGFASIEYSDGTKLTRSSTVTLESTGKGASREKTKAAPPVKKNRFNENVIEFPGETGKP